MFNVESPAELLAIDRVAGELTTRARVALRINPDIDPKTDPHISTGLKKSKFGISAERARDEYKLATTLPHIEIVGGQKHICSKLAQVGPYVDAHQRIYILDVQLSCIRV